MAVEVIVIDNNSSDESVDYLRKKFPWVRLIANKTNMGYASANNLAWRNARGTDILFLNPDTLLAEDCLKELTAFAESHATAGAIGVRMVDGAGRFLPESKRGFPSLSASFFKLSGLIKVFPRSKTIAGYYLGWLPQQENNEVAVLSGACMMVKKQVLEKTGGFDEQFFMYGEDIDLSYRIRQLGFKNYYLGKCTIVHFKGESTTKDLHYTKLFYKAMGIFVKKHYGKRSGLFMPVLQLSIAVSGGLSFLRQLFKRRLPAAAAKVRHTIIAGEQIEANAATEILLNQPQTTRKLTYVTNLTGIHNAADIRNGSELVFCTGNGLYTAMIRCMESLKGNKLNYKFFEMEAGSIIGSNSKNSSGEIMVL